LNGVRSLNSKLFDQTLFTSELSIIRVFPLRNQSVKTKKAIEHKIGVHSLNGM